MTELERTQCAERLQTALDLFEAGIEMVRAQKHRQCPEADEATVDTMIRDWLLDRAKHEFDCPHLHIRPVGNQDQ